MALINTADKIYMGSALASKVYAGSVQVWPAVAATFLLDLYPTASFAYSMRKLRAAYAGPAVKIRRSSDSVQADIGFDASGNFDVAAATAHIGGGTGYITAWYDQSGNGWDVTQTSGVAYEPVYSAAGMNSKPSVDFTGAALAGLFRAGVPGSTACPAPTTTVMAVMDDDANGQQGTLFSWADAAINRFLCHSPYSNTFYWDYGNSTAGSGRNSVAVPAGWHTGGHLLELGRDSGNTQYIMVDGVSLVTTGGMTALPTGGGANWAIGETASGSLNYNGLLSELVIWAADLAANRAAARANVKTYWGTP